MRAWPLVFSYRGVVDGAGYSALVDIKSRVLAEEQESGRIWMDGAQPGGFAIGGQDIQSAYEALKGMFRGILEDMAEESDSFEAFHAEAQRFFDDVDTDVSAEWTKHWWSLSGKSLFLPKTNRGRLEVGYLIKVVSQLEIDKDCAARHFPDVTFR